MQFPEAEWQVETLIQHLGEEEKILGAVAPPLFITSNFAFENVEDWHKAYLEPFTGPFMYSRMTNPTLRMAETKIAALEGTEACKLFSSGMAAISAAIFSCVKSGDHVIAVDTIYGPTKELLTKYLPKFGVECTYVSGVSLEEIAEAARPETTLLVLESPSSFFFHLQDLEAVSQWAKPLGITTMIDNSYATPIRQQPAKFGIDIVCHSATKYLGGHSDVVAGALCCSRERMIELLKNEIALFGGALHPFGAWQIMRGLRTLPIKVKAVAETADKVAAWVRSQPWVSETFHVGFDDFPQSELRDRQMSGWTGLFSFVPQCQDQSKVTRFLEALHLFQLGVSWGGHESLAVGLPHSSILRPETTWVVRLYCGLEHPDDLIRDVQQAASAAGWVS